VADRHVLFGCIAAFAISLIHKIKQGAYMRITQLNLIDAVVLAAFTAFLTQPVYADGVRSEIDAANAQFSAMAAKVDGAGLATLYASDGQVLPAGTATEVGQYELRDKAGKVLDHGKYIVVWRKEGGKWKLLRDMFSTNVPAVKK
jgi:hypothetical protein